MPALCSKIGYETASRNSVQEQLLARAAEMIDDRRRAEYNDTPSNNHWALCNAAGALALLAIQGDRNEASFYQQVGELLAMAEAHLLRHAEHPLSPGPLGISGEGDACALYGMAHMWLWLRASERLQGIIWPYEHWYDLNPWIAKLIPRPSKQPLLPAYDPYAWRNHLRQGHNPFALGLMVYQKQSKRALDGWYEAFGPDGSGDYGVAYPHEMVTILVGLDPDWHPGTGQQSTAHLYDTQKGWFLQRHRGIDGSPVVATIYGKATTGGGWSFEDTGGLRLLSHGTVWAGRSRGDTSTRGHSSWIHETTLSSNSPRASDWPGAHVLFPSQSTSRNKPTAVVLDTSPAWWEKDRSAYAKAAVPGFIDHQIRARRFFAAWQDHHHIANLSGAWILADRISSTAPEPVWRWHTTAKIERLTHGFELIGPTNHSCQLTFLRGNPEQAEVMAGQIHLPVQEEIVVLITLAPRGKHPSVGGSLAEGILMNDTTWRLSEDALQQWLKK
jgi:hypothetical protein